MDPQYPIGRFDPEAGTLADAIADISALPAALAAIVGDLEHAGKLDVPYREDGWTARQVVHHFADSHLNSYVRFRLALTEQRPTIKPYDEKRWADLADARQGPVAPSLRLIEGLHERWVALLRSMTPTDFERVFVHPDRGAMNLERTARLYGWHCRHHLAHLRIVLGAS